MNTHSATQDVVARVEPTAADPRRGEKTASEPSQGKALKGSKYCFRCALDFSPRMMAFHLSHAHLILHCQLCRTPLERLGISRASKIRGQFCSSSCKEEAEIRGLCIACSKEPDGTFKHGACLRCRRAYFNVSRQILEVNGVLGAICRAEVLPAVYQRCDRGTA
jgi:hypothetical protein